MAYRQPRILRQHEHIQDFVISSCSHRFLNFASTLQGDICGGSSYWPGLCMSHDFIFQSFHDYREYRTKLKRIDPGTTEPIPVLQSRFRYYRVDSGNTKSILVLRSRFLYCGVDSCTTETILILQSRFLYYRVDSGIVSATTESIPVLQSRLRYYRVDSGITKSIPVLES